MTVVILRKDLIQKSCLVPPLALDYKTFADSNSMYNTPPTFAIYVSGLVFKWILELGGLKAMEEKNVHKAQLLYTFLDASHVFINSVQPDFRSHMNIPFRIHDASGPSEKLEKEFLQFAESLGLTQLKGHRSVGGIRASLYNAMPLEGVLALIQALESFKKSHDNK